MRRMLDRVTGSVPMYALAVAGLAAQAAVAIVLSLFGQLSYAPLALLASLTVAIAAAWVTGWLAALIVRAPLHPASSIITGLIIFAIMQPTVEPVKLAGLALAATLASASKYLLAARGRHIFNPAAVGTLIVGVIGLSYPVWWVGTPYLLAVTAIGAFLVLYRTQKLALAGVFLAVSFAVFAIVIAVRGGTVADWLSLAVLSSPLVFFAGFMLTEPLTLPPRRWQQLVVATVIALLVAVPYSLPVNKYLFALLVGNAVAFAFGQRAAIRLSYLGKTVIGPATFELAFQPSRPVRFVAGQYMELTLPHRRADFRGSRRYFSISSAPTSDGPLTVAITVPSRSSSFKAALLALEPGARVTGTGVGGDFVLPTDIRQPLLLIAGGIGVTPFASQLAHHASEGRDVAVLYSTSSAGDLPYRALLEQSGAKVILFAPEAPAVLPPGWTYAGAGRITGERVHEQVPDAASRRAFISGPPAFVSELRGALGKLGVKRVHTDSFSGY
jgi:ferredoxin-NADP reductase